MPKHVRGHGNCCWFVPWVLQSVGADVKNSQWHNRGREGRIASLPFLTAGEMTCVGVVLQVLLEWLRTWSLCLSRLGCRNAFQLGVTFPSGPPSERWAEPDAKVVRTTTMDFIFVQWASLYTQLSSLHPDKQEAVSGFESLNSSQAKTLIVGRKQGQ